MISFFYTVIGIFLVSFANIIEFKSSCIIMKKIIHKNLLNQLKSKGVLAVASSMLLVSCGTQMGGYSETDGVYYDPNKDTLPQGAIVGNEGNRVGEYYNYQDQSDIIKNAESNYYEQENKYNDWNDINYTDSDWGSYTGNTLNYYDNSWGWGSPWGWYGYGYRSPYWGWRGGWNLGFSWGWGNTWGSWYGYNPYWGYYDPFWGGGYWGGYYGGYYPYYGYGYYNPLPYKRSGVVSQRNYQSANGNKYSGSSAFRNNANADFRRNASSGFRSNSGFRNDNSGVRNNPNGGFRNPGMNPNAPRQNPNAPRQGGFRNNNNYSTPRQQPSYSPPRNDGGFRSGGSSGGFRSGGSSGGGMRSGGGGGFRSGGR